MIKLWLNQHVSPDDGRWLRVERWADGWLIGFRRHFVIWTPNR